jgi:AAA domain, putative AbiEii toxin, Type IV TA system
MSSRGEWLHNEHEPRRPEPGLALPYLFHGYQVDQGSTIELSGERNDGSEASLRLTIKEPPSPRLSEWQHPRRGRRSSGDGEGDEPILGCLEVSVGDRVEHEVPISEGWGIARDDLMDPSVLLRAGKDEAPVRVITTASMTPNELIEIVDSIQLTDEESRVLDALRIIEPRITNFRPTVTRAVGRGWGGNASRQGVILKLQGIDEVLPIGTLGDGSWRILGLALALAAAKGGVLLVDEIDTGLHYEVMAKMWRLVFETAVRLDVQIFATSHSRDCFESLATIADPDASEERRITIQRIEPDKGRAVLFTAQDIINAAKRGIEVR